MPVSQLPIVLFVWGPSRVVPVKVTAFSVAEKLFDVSLNPTHAEAQITINVLTPDELAAVQAPMAGVANTAYTSSEWRRIARGVIYMRGEQSSCDAKGHATHASC